MTFDPVAYIAFRVTRFCMDAYPDGLGIAVALTDPSIWAQKMAEPAASYGWIDPIVEDDKVTIVFSPEVIARYVDSEEEIDQFLDALMMYLALHVGLMSGIADPGERQRFVEDAMYEQRPDKLTTLNHFQLRALHRSQTNGTATLSVASTPGPAGTVTTFQARNGDKRHVLARTVATGFGTRFVAACGAHAYQIDSDGTAEPTCVRCAEKGNVQ